MIGREQAGVRQPSVPPEGTPDQFRISKVQLLNWGRYGDLETMHVGRAGHAILGPTGAGKSQILDAISAVLMPNPQEFNQAARDDRGQRSERTVYSYARGKSDEVLDSNGHSTSIDYLRPPGTEFPCAVAVTWLTGHGRTVTAARLVWVWKDTATQDEITAATVYAFVEDDFDLQRLGELRPTRGSASPITAASVEKLIDPDRDLATGSQPKLLARMRRVMGIGATEESQRLALLLLRRAQSSKGIYSINDLFKQFVLTEPLALKRWEVALASYAEASALYDVFESARIRTEALDPVPDLAEQYRTAGIDATAKRRLLHPADGDTATRLEVWHAENLTTWVRRAIEDNRLAEAIAGEELGVAKHEESAAHARWADVLSQITAAGGDRAPSIKAQIEAQTKALEATNAARRDYEARLHSVDLAMPTSAGDMTLLHTEITEKLATTRAAVKNLAPELRAAIGKAWGLRDKVETTTEELKRASQRRTNIPDHAASRRSAIAAATKIPDTRLPYAGELIRIHPEYRSWETAITRVLATVASDLLVGESDWSTVTKYVDAHDMRGRIVLTPARERAQARRAPIPGTVPAMVEIDPDSPYRGWLLDELIEHHTFLCVDTPTELRAARPPGVKGAVTKAGMLTGVRGRVIKDDRRTPYTWIGWDNAALIRQLTDTVEALRREHRTAEDLATELEKRRDQLAKQIQTLEELRRIQWSALDTSEANQRIADLNSQLVDLAATEPEITQMRKKLEEHHAAEVAAGNRAQKAQDEVNRLGEEWAGLCTIEDQAKDLLDHNTPLNNDERGYLAKVPFAAPTSHDSIGVPLDQAVTAIRDQIDRHGSDRESAERHLTTIFTHYKQLDERAEIDTSIDSLPTVLAIHKSLVTDDLPRAKNNWLAKVGEDMNDSLLKLLVQIDDDAKSIRRGIQPINDVLAGVEFRDGSALTIDTVDRPSSDLRDFRKTLTAYTGNILGRDTDEVEKTYVRLRDDLRKLEDKSRSGDSWRRRVFDAREHVEFRAIETRPDGKVLVHEGVAGKSGGEGQELIAFILGAALRYRLGDATNRIPTYASIVVDEGLVKADVNYSGRALAALRALGFQLIIGAPREKVTAFEDHVETVAYISDDPDNPERVRIYPLTITEAVELEHSDTNTKLPDLDLASESNRPA